MLSTVAPVLVGAETAHELPMPAIMYGVIALAFFAMMLGVLFAFRQAATKVPSADNTVAHDDHGDDAHHSGDHH